MPSKQRPASSIASFYSEATPAPGRRGQNRARQTTTSSLFPYSTVVASPLPISPPSHRTTEQSRTGNRRSSLTVDTPRTTDTPLYARSDWDEEPQLTQSPSSYSRSSYAGLTSAPPTTSRARHNTLGTLGDIREEDERSESELPYTATDAGEGWAGGELVMSPEALSANSVGWTARPQTNGSWFTTTTAAQMKAHQSDRKRDQVEGPFADPPSPSERASRKVARKSTLPSILELEDLAVNIKSTPSARPLIKPATPQSGGLEPMTPAAHQRLGRMSVAPARYAEEAYPQGGGMKEKKMPVTETLKKNTGVLRFYQVWRPFITPALLVVSALLFTISLLNNPGPVSRYRIAPADAFSNPPRGVTNVTLGANGWCSLDSSISCKDYQKGNFTANESTYNVGEDSLLASLGDLLMALCAMSWLTALYYLTLAFLHFYLFFSLDLPFTHLLDEAASLAPNGAPGKNAAQAEVDIRVRCTLPPFESMEWVWWAWWGHRRAPVGFVFSVISGVLALSTFVLTFALKRSMASEIGTDDIEFGAGAFTPLVALTCLLDPLVYAARWFWDARYEWNTFLHPPEPTTAAIMLPINTEPVAHVRNASGDSFFALRGTMAQAPQTSCPRVTQVGQDLDEETRRWLMAYPADPDLVSLIAYLRKGERNDDFILSEVGLLYVRPGDDETALLVPPKGIIRDELVQDAHEDVDDGQPHQTWAAMMEALQETFWWDTMEVDVKACADRCFVCGVRGTTAKIG